jgi:3-mercaptopyruvate sulfurtransferase SseA
MPNKRSDPSKNIVPVILISVGVILVIGVLLWQLAQNQPAATTAANPSGPTLAVEQIERVSISDAKQALEKKQAVIVDVRSADSYAAEHITGAINIPLGEIDQRANEIKTSQWIIAYCT